MQKLNNQLYGLVFIPTSSKAFIRFQSTDPDGVVEEVGRIPVRAIMDGSVLQRLVPDYLEILLDDVNAVPKVLAGSGNSIAVFDTAIKETGRSLTVEERMANLESREVRRRARQVRKEAEQQAEIDRLKVIESEPAPAPAPEPEPAPAPAPEPAPE